MRLMVLAISNKFRLFLGVFFALILSQSTLIAQISAPTSSSNSTTEYTSGTQNDIFVFCDEAGVNVGELKAVSSDGMSGWDFSWSKWNNVTTSFDTPFNVDNGSESTVNGLEDGLYHVKVEKGAEVRDYQAWVINHTEVVNKPVIIFDKKNCAGVYFKSTYAPIEYKYSNYPNADELIVNQPSPNPLTFVLKRGVNEVGRIPVPNYIGGEVDLVDNGAYESAVNYSVTVVDGCGFEFDSEPIDNITTYVVDATFSYIPVSGEAPLEVTCETEDTNATDYQWHFYEDFDRIDGPVDMRDSLLTDIIVDKNANYTFMHPGKYFIKLIAKSDKGPETCIDIFTIPKEIMVDTSLFDVPNVFTPNGDDKNDEFRLRLYSVKSYSAKIFNRWGRLVYEFQESDVSTGLADKKSSKGWDGKISGKLAAPGTYYYVVEAVGREEGGKRYSKKGAVMLLHNK